VLGLRIRHGLALVTLVVGLSGAGNGDPAAKPVWQIRQQASAAVEAGKLERAERVLAKARKRAPEDSGLAFDHAEVLARGARFAEAFAALEAAVAAGFRSETALLDSEGLEPLRGGTGWDALLARARANEADFEQRLDEARAPLDPEDASTFADVATLLEAKDQAERDLFSRQSDDPWEIRRARFDERWVAALRRLAGDTRDDAERERALIAVLRQRVDAAPMLDLLWPQYAIDKIGRAADSYLNEHPAGENVTEARLARILADVAVPPPDDPDTPRDDWPRPRCAEALPGLSELAGTDSSDEWATRALGVQALCVEQIFPERHDEIREAAVAYLDRELEFSAYDLMLGGSLKIALWRMDGPPDFEAESLDGSTLSLDDLRGKITLLDFWSPG
jgi:hypothetical protein